MSTVASQQEDPRSNIKTSQVPPGVGCQQGISHGNNKGLIIIDTHIQQTACHYQLLMLPLSTGFHFLEQAYQNGNM